MVRGRCARSAVRRGLLPPAALSVTAADLSCLHGRARGGRAQLAGVAVPGTACLAIAACLLSHVAPQARQRRRRRQREAQQAVGPDAGDGGGQLPHSPRLSAAGSASAFPTRPAGRSGGRTPSRCSSPRGARAPFIRKPNAARANQTARASPAQNSAMPAIPPRCRTGRANSVRRRRNTASAKTESLARHERPRWQASCVPSLAGERSLSATRGSRSPARRLRAQERELSR